MPIVITFVVIVLTSVFGFTACSEKIDAGKEGILVNMYGNDKGVSETTLVTGRVFYNPMTQDVVEYPTSVETIDYAPFPVPSKDGSQFVADPSVNISILPGKTPHVYEKYRKNSNDFFQTIVYNRVRNAFRDVVSTKTANDIVENRAGIENEVYEVLKKDLGADGVVVESMTSNLLGNDALQQSMNAKSQSVQEQARKRTENQTMIERAETEAKVKITAAEAEAKANQLRQNSLTDNLIKQQFIEKWDGKLPVYGESPALIRQVTQ